MINEFILHIGFYKTCCAIIWPNLSFQDIVKIKEFIAEAKKLNEFGGDWDRRNRLKVGHFYSDDDTTATGSMCQSHSWFLANYDFFAQECDDILKVVSEHFLPPWPFQVTLGFHWLRQFIVGIRSAGSADDERLQASLGPAARLHCHLHVRGIVLLLGIHVLRGCLEYGVPPKVRMALKAHFFFNQ